MTKHVNIKLTHKESVALIKAAGELVFFCDIDDLFDDQGKRAAKRGVMKLARACIDFEKENFGLSWEDFDGSTH